MNNTKQDYIMSLSILCSGALICAFTCACTCIILSSVYDWYHSLSNHNEQQDLEGSAAQDIGELQSGVALEISILEVPPSYDEVTLPSYESVINGSNNIYS